MPGPGSSRRWILKALPESEAALEQAFEIRLELRPVLRQLGEVRQMLEHLREAEALAERLKDDRRRGQVCAFMTTVLSTLNELDEALVTGTRALEIAARGDLRLRILATSYLTGVLLSRRLRARGRARHRELAALPAEWVHEYFGMAVPASVFGRAWLIMSLAELGRFAEAAKYEAEAIQLAEPTQHAYTIGWAHFAASMLHLLKGDWAKARAAGRALDARTSDKSRHPSSLGGRLLRLGAGADRRGERGVEPGAEGEQLLERQAARGVVGHRGWAYHAVSRAVCSAGSTRRGAWPSLG